MAFLIHRPIINLKVSLSPKQVKGQNYDCNASRVLKGKFCDEELIDIHTDSSKTLSKDSHSETVRLFIKKD